jgi:hypothetical protein
MGNYCPNVVDIWSGYILKIGKAVGIAGSNCEQVNLIYN